MLNQKRRFCGTKIILVLVRRALKEGVVRRAVVMTSKHRK